MKTKILFSALLSLSISGTASAKVAEKKVVTAEPLVSDATIKQQKQLTKTVTLKNGIPLTIRQVPNSDIVSIIVSYGQGLSDLPQGLKSLNDWYWPTASMAAEGYPKEKVFELVEKYSLKMGCSGGIEVSSCGMGTLNEHWDKALPLLAAIVKAPTLTLEDSNLTKDRLIAHYKNVPSDPGDYINEVINGVFYPKGHPYRLNSDEALSELKGLSRRDLIAYHQKQIQSGNYSIVVVGSLPADRIIKDMNAAFGGIKSSGRKSLPRTIPVPTFSIDKAYVFEARDIPTAYIRAKLVAPSIRDKDAVAIRFLYEILSEELGEEVRTKRSLSYSVYSFVIQYDLGIGVIGASTSKPRETLAAITDVIKKLKTKTYSPEELEEYKHVFATSYFLTQETHGSLASALATAMHFYGSTDRLYDLPRLLDKVTPEDIKRLANENLVDMRLGVIFGREEFKDEWAKEFISQNARPPAGKSEEKSH
jgi:predicted Zn-dependent peptidase